MIQDEFSEQTNSMESMQQIEAEPIEQINEQKFILQNREMQLVFF